MIANVAKALVRVLAQKLSAIVSAASAPTAVASGSDERLALALLVFGAGCLTVVVLTHLCERITCFP